MDDLKKTENEKGRADKAAEEAGVARSM